LESLKINFNFSVVIPTLNETDNIDPLLTRLFALDLPQDSFEVIFVDDGSKDGTPDKVRAWEGRAPVRLIERREKPDLTASILAGVAVAQGEVIVVMDADLSHPPERLHALIKPVLDGSHDVSVGSRYVPGGSTEGWPWYRQWLSRVGGWLARPICDVNDATSGFFALRRDLASTIAENARGYKILLELIMAGQGKFRVIEVPICFRDRTLGSSKLSFVHQWTYLQRLMVLAGGTVSIGTASRFAAVGLFGVAVDALLFHWLMSREVGLAVAHVTSFFVAATVNYSFNSKWSFRLHHAGYLRWDQFGRFLTVGIFALLIRGGVLALLIDVWQVPASLAIFPAIAVATMVNYLGSAFYVFPVGQNGPSLDLRWRVAAVGIVGFILLLHLVYIGQAQLHPHEAYYWNYTQHMELSFLDHPPMVAWLIWLGTAVLGNNEFGVRIGAFFCSLVALGYLYALARNQYDKSTAMRTILLLAVLPVGFASSTLMTPDAPLIAAWAATLYYMERALIAGRNSAWLGVGVAFGLGLLSKYTLGLLGIAALLFVILDPTARRWLRRPHPYLAAALALLIFSPVIFWNSDNQWASFLFQSTRRLDTSSQFSVHVLIMQMLAMLTPTGLFAALLVFMPGIHTQTAVTASDNRYRLFVWVFTGVPLTVFLGYSLSHSMDAHLFWNGPVWLAALPTVAWLMVQTNGQRPFLARLQAAWKPTIVLTVLVYAVSLHYLVLGLPGAPYATVLAENYFWKDASKVIEQVEESVRKDTGQEPIIIGMDKFSVASSLAFYDRGDGHHNIRSQNQFGDEGVMYGLWYPSQKPMNQPIILVGRNPNDLERDRNGHILKEMLYNLGPIEHKAIMRDGKLFRHVYYRVADGYLGFPDNPVMDPTPPKT
jgi:dolichol-phosphate mannosyltransferase